MLEVSALLARRYRFSINRNVGGFFASQTRRYRFILRGTLVDISTRGDTAYSDEVVLVIVHNLFLGILGVSALHAKGYRFKAKPVYRFLLGGTAS